MCLIEYVRGWLKGEEETPKELERWFRDGHKLDKEDYFQPFTI